MALGKQAKILTPKQISLCLKAIEDHRHPDRDRALFLLSHKAGLRAKEIASIKWSMVMDGEGSLTDFIHLEDKATKGRSGRVIPINSVLQCALQAWLSETPSGGFSDNVISSERGRSMSADSVRNWFFNFYKSLGFEGCSSHSGRRTFITNGARKIVECGGSLKDIQMLAGHSSLQMTQRYIEANNDAQKRLVDLI